MRPHAAVGDRAPARGGSPARADPETRHFARLRHGGGLVSLDRAFTVEPMGIPRPR
jgi:hypothetical protein